MRKYHYNTQVIVKDPRAQISLQSSGHWQESTSTNMCNRCIKEQMLWHIPTLGCSGYLRVLYILGITHCSFVMARYPDAAKVTQGWNTDLSKCTLLVILKYCSSGVPGHRRQDRISHSVTLSWYRVNQSLFYRFGLLTLRFELPTFHEIGLHFYI